MQRRGQETAKLPVTVTRDDEDDFSKYFGKPSKDMNQRALWALLVIGSCALFRLMFHDLACHQQDLFRSLSNNDEACEELTPLPPIKTRADFALFVQQKNFTRGIEIGVQLGLFAEHMLTYWSSCESYKLVDLWAHQENYKDSANVENPIHEDFYQQTKVRLKPWEAKTEYYRMYSSEAAKMIAKEKELVDFIYVDARHDYCGSKEDMEMYWPLLKPGGIMAGHDFMANDEVAPQDWSICMDGSIHPEAVKGAVMEFANKRKLPVGVTYREGAWNSWWIQKPLC